MRRDSSETYPNDVRSLLGEAGGSPPSSVPPERIKASGKMDLHKIYTDHCERSTVAMVITRHCEAYGRRLVAGTFLGMSPPHLTAKDLSLVADWRLLLVLHRIWPVWSR